MWIRCAALCLLATLLAGGATAGAWPRGKGQSFLSLEGTVSASLDGEATPDCEPPPGPIPGTSSVIGTILHGPPEPVQLDCSYDTVTETLLALGLPAIKTTIYGSIFYEYGVGERLTLGLDAGYDIGDKSWTALGFLRRSFNTAGTNVWALEIAAGPTRMWDGSSGVEIRPGLHWGRGTDWGWLSAESYLVHRTGSDGMAYKLDLTAGWNRSEATSWILQVQTADYPGSDPTVRLAPSWVRSLRKGLRLELGLLADVTGRDEVGMSAATWFEF